MRRDSRRYLSQPTGVRMQGQSGEGPMAPWGENVGFTPLGQPTDRNEPPLRARHQGYSTEYARLDP